MKVALALFCLLFATSAAANAGGDLDELVERLRSGDESAAKRLISLGKSAHSAIPGIEAVMGERPRGGKGNFEQAELAAKVLAGLGAPGRVAMARALESGNPQSIVAAAGEIASFGEKGVFFVPSLLSALKTEAPRRLMSLRWHPWQPLYRAIPAAVITTLAAIGPGAKAAVPDLKARVTAKPGPYPACAQQSFEALIRIVPDDPSLPDLLAVAVERKTIYLANRDLGSIAPWLEERSDAAIPCLVTIFREYSHYGQPTRAVAGLLADSGTAAHGALVRLLREAKTGHPPKTLVQAMADAKNVPPAAVPLVAGYYREGLDSGAERWTTALLAEGGEPGVSAVMDTIGKLGWHYLHWRLLVEAAPPDFVERLSMRWFAEHRGEFSRDPFVAASAGPARTRSRGGGGGGAFAGEIRTGRRLVGLRLRSGAWGGNIIVKAAQPLFRGPDGAIEEGVRRGKGGRAETELIAKPGYAVGGLLIRSGGRIDGLALVFLREKGDRLDHVDAYLSPWFGGYGGGGPRILGLDGTPVAGIHGRSGRDLDAIGLVAGE